MTLGKLLLQTLVAAGDSATFGALFQVEKRHYLACAITGAAGWVTYCLAVEAGCDVLLMPDGLADAYDAVLAAVQNGTLSEDRLDLSVNKILRMKAQFCA